MKVLVVKKKDSCWPFVEEQLKALNGIGVENVYHWISGHGIWSYIRDIQSLKTVILREKPDVIHAHYGISGYYVCLVVRMMRLNEKIPVVVTYHGSDINKPFVRSISKRAARMASHNIFVSAQLMQKAHSPMNSQVIPCGITWDDWKQMDKAEAKTKRGLMPEKQYVLFSSDFNTAVKNPQLAFDAIGKLQRKGWNVDLLELKGYNREQVNTLMHAVDCLLMTSQSEGSPQVIKEAMVCGCPIVTTKVGDVEEAIGQTEGCFYTTYDSDDCARQLENALSFAAEHGRTDGHIRIAESGYGNDVIAQKIKDIYTKLTHTR